MTREEAIQYIDGLHVVPCEQLKEFCDERNTAIDMAIEALSKVDTTENPKCLMSHEEAWAEIESDLIRREDAIQALLSHFIPQTYTGDDVAHADRLARKIMGAIPSADRPHGEWIEKTIIEIDQALALTKTLGGSYYDGVFNGLHMAREIIKKHCGARMKGGEQNDA